MRISWASTSRAASTRRAVRADDRQALDALPLQGGVVVQEGDRLDRQRPRRGSRGRGPGRPRRRPRSSAAYAVRSRAPPSSPRRGSAPPWLRGTRPSPRRAPWRPASPVRVAAAAEEAAGRIEGAQAVHDLALQVEDLDRGRGRRPSSPAGRPPRCSWPSPSAPREGIGIQVHAGQRRRPPPRRRRPRRRSGAPRRGRCSPPAARRSRRPRAAGRFRRAAPRRCWPSRGRSRRADRKLARSVKASMRSGRRVETDAIEAGAGQGPHVAVAVQGDVDHGVAEQALALAEFVFCRNSRTSPEAERPRRR